MLSSAPLVVLHDRFDVAFLFPFSTQNLDEYEGVGKGYYARHSIEVLLTASSKKVEAQVYVLTQPSADLRRAPFLEEYTLDFHQKFYNPIRHIRVKQQLYLSEQHTASAKS